MNVSCRGQRVQMARTALSQDGSRRGVPIQAVHMLFTSNKADMNLGKFFSGEIIIQIQKGVLNVFRTEVIDLNICTEVVRFLDRGQIDRWMRSKPFRYRSGA